MISKVDINKGILISPAANLSGEIFIKHPSTNKLIKNTEIPYWEEIREMVTEASNVVPEVGYIGWDIAITPKGPIIIEGNANPGHQSMQLKPLLSNNIGYRKIYEKFL